MGEAWDMQISSNGFEKYPCRPRHPIKMNYVINEVLFNFNLSLVKILNIWLD
jgi:hypothetical protein